MGGASSTIMKEALTGEKEFWTEAEKIENQESLERQKRASEFILKYMFLDVPVRLVKNSVDPMAPLWIEVDPDLVKSVLENESKALIDKTTLQSIPSGCLIDHGGGIKVYFTNINVVYDLTIEDIDSAIVFYESKSMNRTENSSPSRMVISGPKPKPPILKCAHTNSLELEWILPQPCGVVQRLEVQYVRLNYRSKIASFDETIEEKQWFALVSQSWEYSHFLSYCFDNLKPGSAYKFRIRYRNIMGYSEYSESSEVISTLSDIPDPPSPPVCSAITCDSAQLHWMYPKRDNGSKVTGFVLFGKSVGDEFVELFRGNRLSYLSLDLHPGFAYSFKVAAVNELGMSMCSETKSIQTPNKPSQKSMTAFEEFMEQNDEVNNFFDAWNECWDPKTQKYFYFNRITGTRQLACPEVLKTKKKTLIINDEDEESETLNDAMMAVEKDKSSRVQRYQFFQSLKTTSISEPVQSTSSFPDLRLNVQSNIEDDNENGQSRTLVRKDLYLLSLKRGTLLADAYKKISKATLHELQKRIKVEFSDEEGIDSGGVGKEAFLLISRQAAQYCGPSFRGWMRWTPSKEKGTLLYFSDEGMLDGSKSSSNINSESNSNNNNESISLESVLELEKLKLNGPKFAHFCGRLLGKALFDRQHVDFPLCPLLLKLMVSGFSEVENQLKRLGNRENCNNKTDDLFRHLNDLDLDYSKSLKWMLENDITNILFETFSVEVGNQTIALCDGGIKKEVTENNKWEYVNLLIQWKELYSVSKCLAPFLQGFHDFIPLQLLKEHNISHDEIDLLLNGKKTLNIEEIRAYTIYQGSKEFCEKHLIVIWLWQIFRELEDEEQRQLLQFFTGSERVPLDGYDPPLNITEGLDMMIDSLPRAHTCFNQLVIPSYISYSIMKDKIRFAIKNVEGFTLA